MSTYCRGHPKSTWWDKPPQPPQLKDVLSGPVAFAILDEAMKDGNKELVSAIKKPTETDILKQYLPFSEEPVKSSGPQFDGEALTIPGVQGGLSIPVDNTDPLQAMRQWVRKSVSKNTGMRPQDIHFSGEPASAGIKKKPPPKKPVIQDRPKPAPAPKPAAKPEAPAKPKAAAKAGGAALLFPGQGSQYVKMLSESKEDPVVRGYCDTAKRILGYDLLDLCLAGPEKELEETAVCQPAMFLGGMAGIEKLRKIKPEAAESPKCVAGLSLGEYTALCAAGVFTFEQGLELVKLRGEAMSEAAKSKGPGGQLMLSVAGLDRDVLDKLCAENRVSDDDFCVVANVLFPKGFALSGTKDAIERMQVKATEAGAMQSKVLKTSGAFHTVLMKPAQEKLEDAIKRLLPEMKPPKCDVYMNVNAQKIPAGTPPSDIVGLLGPQLVSPVLWEPSVKAMMADGVTEWFEVGPMKQLKAMMKRIDKSTWEKTTNIDV